MPESTTTCSRFQDVKTLFHLAFSRASGTTHADRLESFYAGQASGYDSFRSRLLHGREALIESIPFPSNGVWVDFGAGTGENVDRLADRIDSLRQVTLVDLCPSLLRVADQRIRARGWKHVTAVEADATSYCRDTADVDVVTFSYSLTMIPNWFQALENAWQLLKPGGRIGIVDFYVSRKHPDPDKRRHRWLTRSLWPLWFGCDNVWLSHDHLPFLQHRFETIRLDEEAGKVPYLPWVRVPYYVFVGRKQ
jgi:S-adenosylmethionine-diacylgycerolhomoserine-N-methlytransferase